MYTGNTGTVPQRHHLRHWQEVCRFIDAEPYRSLWYPFHSRASPPHPVPPISARLLQRLAKFKLVRHRANDCAWVLSPNWRKLLANLAAGVVEEPETIETVEAPPTLVTYGIDTLYVNLLAEDLPPRLVGHLTHFKDLALANNDAAVTPWLFCGVPLNMYKSGKGTSGKRGVSWGYILRNDLIEVKLRKIALSGIVGMVRLSAQVLWEQTPTTALDRMRAMVRGMWRDGHAFGKVGYQVSQMHLCADIANFTLTPDLLRGVVSHSLSQTIHLPSDEDDADPAMRSVDDDELDSYLNEESWEDDSYPDPLPVEVFDDETNLEEEEDEDRDEKAENDNAEEEDDESPAWAAGGAQIHLFGKAIQGFTFSPKSALSAAWYDKAREVRRSGKGWMTAIHEANGWQPGTPLTRVENRLKRPVFREVAAGFGKERPTWCDDPWEAVQHESDFWGVAVGLPPEADTAPDVFPRGWIRLAVPNPHDTTKARWPNHPAWDIIQRVPFGQRVPQPLQRVKRPDPLVDRLYAEAYGILITIAAVRGSYLKHHVELARELEALEDWADGLQERRGEAFGQSVRERARMMGKALPLDMIPALPRKRGRSEKETA